MPVLRAKRRGETFGRAMRTRHESAKLSARIQCLLLLPRPNENRTIMFPDIGIVEARF